MKRRKKTDICIYTVMGKGHFPLDMLRYDSCWPHRQEDINGVDNHDLYERMVEICSRNDPTIKRWESFGWKVVDIMYRAGR